MFLNVYFQENRFNNNPNKSWTRFGTASDEEALLYCNKVSVGAVDFRMCIVRSHV